MGAIGFLFVILVFLIFWIFFFSSMFTLAGNQYVTANSPTGFVLFFYSNLNLFVGISFLLSILIGGSLLTR